MCVAFGPGNIVTLFIREAYFRIYLDVDSQNGLILNVMPDKLPDLPNSDEHRVAIRQALTVRNPLPIESAFVPLGNGAPSGYSVLASPSERTTTS